MKWSIYQFSSDTEWVIRTFAASEDIAEKILHRSLSRHPENQLVQETQLFSRVIDLPGMVMSDRGYWSLDLDGLDLKVPYGDFETIREMIKEADPIPLDDGLSCYRIVVFHLTFYMNPEQRLKIIRKMGEDSEEIAKKAAVEDDEFYRRLQKLNSKYVDVSETKAALEAKKLARGGGMKN